MGKFTVSCDLLLPVLVAHPNHGGALVTLYVETDDYFPSLVELAEMMAEVQS